MDLWGSQARDEQRSQAREENGWSGQSGEQQLPALEQMRRRREGDEIPLHDCRPDDGHMDYALMNQGHPFPGRRERR